MAYALIEPNLLAASRDDWSAELLSQEHGTQSKLYPANAERSQQFPKRRARKIRPYTAPQDIKFADTGPVYRRVSCP